MASLSVCCVTGDPPKRVAAVLGALRGVAEEIVVAADASSQVGTAPEVAAVADRICEIDYEPPLERYLAWLHSLCQGDWIFRIDGDEMPSTALVKGLPNLMQARDVVQYRLPRRWLFGDAEHWLDQPPWSPDYQIRLVRNDPAMLRFPGTVHSSVEPVLPARYLEMSFYHLVLLTTSREERERRIALYEELPRSQGHVVANEEFYLPELRAPHAVRPVPIEDVSLITPALVATGTSGHVARLSPERIARRDIERTWALRKLPPAAYDVVLTPLADDVAADPRQERLIPIRIENRGPERFPWGEFEPRIRLGYRWLDGEAAGMEGPRTLLPSDVAPGASAIALLRVVAPSRSGRARLEVDLVHEGVRWFGTGATVTMEVAAPALPVEDPRATDEGQAVCVTGVYRSGTSLIARMVNVLGVDFGPESLLQEPGADNPSGFWESRPIVLLNEEILAAFGGTPLRPPTLAEGWEQSPALDPLRRRAHAAIHALRRSNLAGWKDPATSLTLPFWKTVTSIGWTILCIRDPAAVTQSLRRTGWPEAEVLDDDAAARLWLRYVVSAYTNDPDCLVVRYDDVFLQVDALVDLIVDFLRLPSPDRETRQHIHRLVEPARRHVGPDEGDDGASAQVRLARAVYETIHDSERVAPLIEAVTALWAQQDGERHHHEQEQRSLQRRFDELAAVHDATMSRLAVRAALTLSRPFGRASSYARSRLQRP
jgi:hypothetical protein